MTTSLEILRASVAAPAAAVPLDPTLAAHLSREWAEVFDQHKLRYILEHLDEFKMKCVGSANEAKWVEQRVIMERYLASSVGGRVSVRYHYTGTTDFGRLFANRSLSLQSFNKAVRRTIAAEFYDDIDIENAHPTILSHLCAAAGIQCEMLNVYITSRDEMLTAIVAAGGVSRDKAKQIVLAVMNGGKSDYDALTGRTEFLIRFKAEMAGIFAAFIVRDQTRFDECKAARVKAGKDYNHEASFVNKLLCDMENRILAVMVAFFKVSGLVNDVCVLCFDGVMIPKAAAGVELGPILEQCAASVKKQLGITIALKAKPMGGCLELPTEIERYVEPTYEFFDDHSRFVNKEVSMDKLNDWISKSMVYITGGGKSTMYTRNWRVDPRSHRREIYYESVDVGSLLFTLRMVVNVLNPNYDPMAAAAVAAKKQKKEKPTEEEISACTTYSFTRLNKYVEDAIERRALPTKNSIDFYPFLKRNVGPSGPDTGNSFNIFTGFPYDYEYKGMQTFEQSGFYKHLRDEMFNGCAGELEHFLDFIADLVQQPATLRHCGHVFYTAQGCGKGMIAEWIKYMIGAEHCITFDDTKTFLTTFNPDRMNKLVYVMEEMRDRGDCFLNHDKLKNAMSAPTVRIEFKGGAIIHPRNSARYLFMTNNENALLVEHDDRRFTMHHGSDRHANDGPYFTPLWTEIENPEFAHMSFEYFATRRYDVANVMCSFTTGYKRSQQISALSNPIKYMIWLMEEPVSPVQHTGDKYPSTQLYADYDRWCKSMGLKVHSAIHFNGELKHIGIDAPANVRIDGRQVRCYLISKEAVLAALRRYLRLPTFEFAE
jgi:hypothetical protein